MKNRRGEEDPGYFEYTGTYHVGSASAGLEFLTAADKKEFKAKQENRVIGFAIKDGENPKKHIR